MKHFSIVFAIVVLTTLVTQPSNGITWGCLNPSGQIVESKCETIIEPTPSPSEFLDVQPSLEPSPTPSETLLQQENLPDPSSSPEVQPSPTFLPNEPVVVVQEPVVPIVPNVSVTPVVESTSISSPSSSPYPSQQASPLPSFELPVVEDIQEINQTNFLPGVTETLQKIFEPITRSLVFVSNLGSEFTPAERKQAQQVVLGAIIISQLANPRRVK